MYTFESRVRYTELNHRTETLDFSSIINYFQDCSTFQSEDLNIGISYLQEHNRIWLMHSWQLIINRPVRLGENITIGTWAHGFKGFYGYRNFLMSDEKDEVTAYANSIWVYYDSSTGKPARVIDNAGYTVEPPYPMDYAERKIELPDNFTVYPEFSVIKSNIDSYNHVNNGQYIKMAEEFLPEDLAASEMRVEYKRQAVLGDVIIPKVAINDGSYLVVLSDTGQKPYAVVEFMIDK